MPTPDPTAEPTALVVEENIYASMRTRVLADGFSPLRSKKSHKKLDKNIGHHLKKKKRNVKSVPTSIRFSPLHSKKSEPKTSFNLPPPRHWLQYLFVYLEESYVGYIPSPPQINLSVRLSVRLSVSP